MISVIIPALNESPTVGEVVAFARREPRVAEVLVIDDGSTDGTPELARAAGARVLTSTLLGKGASMQDGLWAAHHPLVVYLDADLRGLHPELLRRLTQPLAAGEADFVKASFTRAAGRVTALTARPLLRTFFPELAGFAQPLGGIVAARRSLLKTLRFEDDYGVDVGLLIDAVMSGARVAQADVGHIEHDGQPLSALEEMATQVARTILGRAARHGRLKMSFVGDVQEAEREAQSDLAAVLERVAPAERLALFDMDGTLLRGRFIVELAHRTGRGRDLARYLDNFRLAAGERTEQIARVFGGVPHEEFQAAARQTPLMPGAREAVVALRAAGYRVGVVSDSFRVAAEVVRRRVFADFSVAHVMRFRHGRATGQVTLAPAMTHPDGCSLHPSCKANVLRHLTERMGIGRDAVLAVGDGENDVCLLRAAGTSVAFCARLARVRSAATHAIDGALTEILALLNGDRPTRGAG
jgi:HAD superfamily phosphoserine phosphatase-like hydrolase